MRSIPTGYSPGCRFVLISDGAMANDLYDISEEATRSYVLGVRAMAEKVSSRLEIIDFHDFVPSKSAEQIRTLFEPHT